jgi:hypothetical protein
LYDFFKAPLRRGFFVGGYLTAARGVEWPMTKSLHVGIVSAMAPGGLEARASI